MSDTCTHQGALSAAGCLLCRAEAAERELAGERGALRAARDTIEQMTARISALESAVREHIDACEQWNAGSIDGICQGSVVSTLETYDAMRRALEGLSDGD